MSETPQPPDDGTQDVPKTTKTGQSLDKKTSSATLEPERKDTQAR